jgi:predicted DNA-binding protein
MNPMKKRVTFTLESELIEQLKKKSDETMIPQARIVEQAIKEYLEKMK